MDAQSVCLKLNARPVGRGATKSLSAHFRLLETIRKLALASPFYDLEERRGDVIGLPHGEGWPEYRPLLYVGWLLSWSSPPFFVWFDAQRTTWLPLGKE